MTNLHRVDPGVVRAALSQSVPRQSLGVAECATDILQNGQLTPVVWVEPETEQQVAEVFQRCSQAGWNVAIAGGETQLGGEAIGEDVDVVVRMAPMNQIVDFAPADLVVTVQPGVTLDTLQRVLAGEGKMLPLDPWLPPSATMGGIAATGTSGPRRVLYGTVRDMAIGLRVVYPDGVVIRTGGKVVKNVAGYDMTKLFIGSAGTLGVLTELTFKLRPLPLHRETVLLTGSLYQVERVVSRLMASVLIPARAEVFPERRLCGMQMGALMFDKEAAGEQTLKSLWTLAVDCDENKASAHYQTEQLRTFAAEEEMKCDVVTGLDADSWWLDLAQSVTDSPFVLRIAAPPTEWAKVAATASQLAPHSELRWSVSVGVGRVFSREITDDAAVTLVSTLREQVASSGGSVVMERASVALRQCLSPFGAIPGTARLFERIKEQIDPQHILRPGSLVGGI